MFAIKSVEVHNFKSFKGEHFFEFPTKPGLYFLTGSNEAEPSLGSNGAGKSTLLDAVYWCLYGKTLRGLKASDVISWGHYSCTVTLHVTVVDDKSFIIREQNPNSLTLNGKPVSQETLEKYIRLNAESFVYSVISPQFGKSFFELKPAEKLTLFSDIMGLEFWLEKSKQAAEAADAIAKQTVQVSNEIHTATAAWSSAKNDLQELGLKENSFEASRKEATMMMIEGIDDLEMELSELAKAKTKKETALSGLLEQKHTQAGSLDHVDKAKAKHAGRCNVLRAKIELLRKASERLEKGLGAVCPTCFQRVNPSLIKAEKRAIVAEINKLQTEWEEADKFFVKTSETSEQLTEAIDKVNEWIGTLKTEMAVSKSRFETVSNRITELREELKAKKTEINPFTAMVAERKAKMDSLDAKLDKLNNQFDELNAKYAAIHYWVNGFKRVRLFIIEETLRQLEIEVNNSLASLGLVDWRIAFDVERENKSGGVTKGFVVFIHCPANPEPVRWESWSGGETQRLQLAGDFGLANLIMTQAGLTNSIEFYDEPSEHLSVEGLNDLAETLYERAINDNKCIYLVDHRIPDFGDFEHTIKVTKTEQGSIIE